jgi:hypothetical protein
MLEVAGMPELPATAGTTTTGAADLSGGEDMTGRVIRVILSPIALPISDQMWRESRPAPPPISKFCVLVATMAAIWRLMRQVWPFMALALSRVRNGASHLVTRLAQCVTLPMQLLQLPASAPS